MRPSTARANITLTWLENANPVPLFAAGGGGIDNGLEVPDTIALDYKVLAGDRRHPARVRQRLRPGFPECQRTGARPSHGLGAARRRGIGDRPADGAARQPDRGPGRHLRRYLRRARSRNRSWRRRLPSSSARANSASSCSAATRSRPARTAPASGARSERTVSSATAIAAT